MRDAPTTGKQTAAPISLGDVFDPQDRVAAAQCLRRGRDKRRHRGDQGFRVGMTWIIEDLVGSPCFHHAALLHDGNAVGDLRDDAEIVGNEQDSSSLSPLQIADQRQDLRLRRDIEGRRRLVRDQNPRLERKRHGDHGPLALAAGKLMRIGPARAFRVGDVDVSQKIQDATLDLGMRRGAYGS